MDRKHVLFDCYQTLLDTDIDPDRQNTDRLKGWETFVGLLDECYGIRTDMGRFADLLERRKSEYYLSHDEYIHHHDLLELISDVLGKDLKAKLSEPAVRDLIYEYRKASRGYVRPYPGVRDVLSTLSERYTLSLASYTQAAFTMSELKDLGIDGYFSHLIFSSDIGLRKGNADFYGECLQIVGAAPSDCVMVGDNYHDDVMIPSGLGMRAVWIRNPKTCADDFSPTDASLIPIVDLESFGKLPEVIEGVFSHSGG